MKLMRTVATVVELIFEILGVLEETPSPNKS
jgi:hypothetical protein